MNERPPHHNQERHAEHRCFRHSHAHLLTSVPALIIGEIVDDPKQKWRWIRISSIATPLIAEAYMSWQDRVRRKEQHELELADRLSRRNESKRER